MQCYLPLKSDLVSLQSSLDRVFALTKGADRLTVFQFCNAFQRLLSDQVSENLRNTPSQASASFSDNYGELTSNSLIIKLLERLMELLIININRIEVIWDSFVVMLNLLLQNQSQKQ